MRHSRSGISFVALSVVASLFLGVMLVAPPKASTQATISTGSVQGAILDPKGAVVVSAKVTITNKDTGQMLEPEVTSAGTYNSGPLPPGQYVVRVAAKGFKTVEQTVVVAVGIITTANVTFEHSSSRAFRFRMAPISTPRKMASPLSPSLGILGELLELRWTGLISAMKPSGRPPKISHRSPSGSFRWANRI